MTPTLCLRVVCVQFVHNNNAHVQSQAVESTMRALILHIHHEFILPLSIQLVYRDRAKERRDKYGTPAIIPGWKKRLEREIDKAQFSKYDASASLSTLYIHGNYICHWFMWPHYDILTLGAHAQ